LIGGQSLSVSEQGDKGRNPSLPLQHTSSPTALATSSRSGAPSTHRSIPHATTPAALTTPFAVTNTGTAHKFIQANANLQPLKAEEVEAYKINSVKTLLCNSSRGTAFKATTTPTTELGTILSRAPPFSPPKPLGAPLRPPLLR
jgi:hypothetical protein